MADYRVSRFLQLLVNRGYVEERPVVVNGLKKNLFRFGPLGTLLRKNILKQWWDAVVLAQPTTFCVENPVLMPHVEDRDEKDENKLLLHGCFGRTTLSHDCMDAYLTSLKLSNGQLPVSVASSGHCFKLQADETVSDSARLLSNGLSETQLLVQHYCPPATVAQVSDYCLRARLRWWRKFSSNPSKFSSSSSSLKTENSSGNNNSETVISYTFPWGTESVETICNLGDVPVRKMEAECAHSFQGQYHRKAFHPHLIECRSSVEKCMSVFLTDAYREREVTKKGTRQKSADTRLVLQLHAQLSPYQVAMSSTGSRLREVRVLTEQVARELREAGISVLDCPANSDSMGTQYRRNDELGVPYTVVMSDQTLDSGIIGVRNRDTRLKHQQHISKLQSLLSKNISGQDLA